MKRFFCLMVFFVFMLSCTSSFAIEFYDIPWDISIEELTTALNDRGLSADKYDVASDASLYPWRNVFYKHYTNAVSDAGYKITLTYLYNDTKPHIAGYPVQWFDFYAHYDVADGALNRDIQNSHYYQAHIWFDISDEKVNDVYDILSKKLTTLYGNGTESEFVTSGNDYYTYTYTIWEGDGHTAVCLHHYKRKNKEDQYLILDYGLTDRDTALLDIQAAIEEEARMEEEMRIMDAADDITGL